MNRHVAAANAEETKKDPGAALHIGKDTAVALVPVQKVR